MLYEMNGENLTGTERTSFTARGILEGTLQEARASMGSASRNAVPGISRFEKAIEESSEVRAPDQQEQFERILAFVRELEEAGLAEPVSYPYSRGGAAAVAGGRKHLAYFSCESSDRKPYIGVRKGSFDRYAPDALERVWGALGKGDRTGQSVWAAGPFSEELFKALREAYGVANGGGVGCEREGTTGVT